MKQTFPTKNYVVFDFETTGLSHETDDVIQMSAIKKKDGLWMNPFNMFIKINRPLPQIIKDLTKITDEMLVTEGVEPEIAWTQFHKYIENLPLIGHNIINFDCKFLDRLLLLHTKESLPHRSLYIDTAMIYKAKKLAFTPFWYEDHYAFCRRVGNFRAYGVKYNLARCCEDLKIDVSGFQAHRSDSDIAMTNLIYEAFLKDL